MKEYLTPDILKAVVAKAKGEIAVHTTNVQIYLQNPAGIGEHSDIVEAVIAELEEIARWQDILEATDIFEYDYYPDDCRCGPDCECRNVR